MKIVNQEQIIQVAQVLLAVLSDEEGTTPNKFLEGVVSGKSMLRAIVAGNLVVCEQGPAQGISASEEAPAEVVDAVDLGDKAEITPSEAAAAAAGETETPARVDAAPVTKS